MKIVVLDSCIRIQLSLFETLLSTKSSFDIPFSDIKHIRAQPISAKDFIKGFRVGTEYPGCCWARMYHWSAKSSFWFIKSSGTPATTYPTHV